MSITTQGARPTNAEHPTKKHPSAPPAVKRRALGLSLLATVATLLSASCGGGDRSSPDVSAGGGGSGVGAGGSNVGAGGTVAISVGTVASPSILAGSSPGAERYFLTVQATLHDVSAPEAVPVGFTNYTLATTKGLVIMPSTVSALLSMPCASDTSVSAGAAYSCTIVFEMPSGDSPTLLTYADPRGDTATAPVSYTVPPLPVSAACNTFATYQHVVSAACDQCVTMKCVPPDQACVPFDSGACAACPLFPTSPGYCTCEDACLGACWPTFDARFQCYVDQCAGACM
jgi:hypothetical protein